MVQLQMVCADDFHKKRSALMLGHGRSSCLHGSTIVTHTLTPYVARLLITQNPALWPSEGELNQPEMFSDRWHPGSEDPSSKDGDGTAKYVMKFHSCFSVFFLTVTLLTAEKNHRKGHRCDHSLICSF